MVADAAFANGGVGVQPHVIARVRTAGGKQLYLRRNASFGRVIDPQDVAMMNQMMQETLLTGTARKAELPGWQAAGKTGTSQEWRDAWFVGYTSYLVAGVWLGNDDGSPTKKVSGGNLPVEIWSRFDERRRTRACRSPGCRSGRGATRKPQIRTPALAPARLDRRSGADVPAGRPRRRRRATGFGAHRRIAVDAGRRRTRRAQSGRNRGACTASFDPEPRPCRARQGDSNKLLGRSEDRPWTRAFTVGGFGRRPSLTPERLDKVGERLLVHVGNGDIGQILRRPIERRDNHRPFRSRRFVRRSRDVSSGQFGHGDFRCSL